MKIRLVILTLLIAIFSVSTVLAGCWYGGQEFSEGDKINGYTCQANGDWN